MKFSAPKFDPRALTMFSELWKGFRADASRANDVEPHGFSVRSELMPIIVQMGAFENLDASTAQFEFFTFLKQEYPENIETSIVESHHSLRVALSN